MVDCTNLIEKIKDHIKFELQLETMGTQLDGYYEPQGDFDLMNAALAALEAMEWKRIEDKSPPTNGTDVIMAGEEESVGWQYAIVDNGYTENDSPLECGWRPSEFTHWKYINPPTPKEE